MNKQLGIWIDSKKAVIISLEEHNIAVITINSNIEGRIRIPGEGKWFTRFAEQYLDFEKKKQRRRANEIRIYLERVMEQVRTANELVIFGPAGMKTELAKRINEDLELAGRLMAVKTADSMTENQAVAWVKTYFLKTPGGS